MFCRHWLLFVVVAGCSGTPTDARRMTSKNEGRPADARASTAYGTEIRQLKRAIPKGWSYQIRKPSPPKNPLDAAGLPGPPEMEAEIRLSHPGIRCVVTHGAQVQRTSIEHPVLTLYAYRAEDRDRLIKYENQYRRVSSHCSKDVLLAQTKRYYIAWSPCGQAYARDKRCLQIRRNLITRLRKFLGRFK